MLAKTNTTYSKVIATGLEFQIRVFQIDFWFYYDYVGWCPIDKGSI